MNCVLSYVLISTLTGSVYSHTLPLPHEKPPEWEQPIVITEEFFPPHPPPHHPPHTEFKEIIGIELQRIPFHGGPEHEMHKEQEILEHRKHEILEHEHGHEFLKPHVPPEVLEHREHEILTHEIPPPPPGLLEHEHGEHEHYPHGFHDVLEHEHKALERREHERREHERREHELREHERREHEHEILEHEHEPHEHPHEHEHHDILVHEPPHEFHRPPWEDPDFILSEEEHQHEHEHEFHHEELFPEIPRRRTNTRREGSSSEGSSRRNNSNSNRRENSNRRGNSNSNRRENSNRQGNSNRREGNNSNRESSRRNREGGIRTEELFPRRNRQNNNRRNNSNNNSSNNRRNNNNSSRRSSNLEELAALEEELMLDPEVISSHEISRPERDINSHYSNDRRETSIYETSPSKQHEQNFHSQKSSNRPTSSRGEEPIGGSRQQQPTQSSSSNQGHSVTFDSNVNEYSNSDSSKGRPDRPSSNIFAQGENYLTLDGSNAQRPSSRPTGSSFNNSEQSLNQQGGSSGSFRPGQSSTFASNRPDEFSNQGTSRPSFLGSRPGSGRPLVPGSLASSSRPTGFSFNNNEQNLNQQGGSSGNSRPGQSTFGSSRPGELSNQGSSSFLGSRPDSGKPLVTGGSSGSSRPTGASSSSSNQENIPKRPSSGSSGLFSNHENRPGRPGYSVSHSSKERPNRPSTGSSSQYTQFEERPSRPGSNTGSSRPTRPSDSSFSNQSSFHEQSSKPHIPSSRPEEESSRPRPSNGNNLNNESHLITTVQENSWLWPDRDGDKQNRRAYSGSNKNQSTTTRRPIQSGGSIEKQHANLKLLPTGTCGVDLGNKIIGGDNAQLDEFPWMALLQHSSADGTALGYGCGGSLISSRYILTAAHCIKGPAIGNNVRVSKVRLGEFDTSSDVDCQGELCNQPPVDVAVEEIIVHPKYRATDRAQLNDIALIRLKDNVKTSAYISPICLPIYDERDHIGERLVVSGWGKTSNGQKGASSKIKQKVSLPVISLKDCSPFYSRINIQLNNTQMCAGGERGKDSCQGDSGGPLMGNDVVDSQIRWQVYGIVSFGPEDCGIDNVAGVYTKVSEYVDWILDNMKR